MTTKLKMLPVRVSPALRALIDQAGPVNAAARALIILGAEAAGLDLGGMEREVAGLLAENLIPALLEKLRRILVQEGEAAILRDDNVRGLVQNDQSADLHVPPALTSLDDPFTAIGVEV